MRQFSKTCKQCSLVFGTSDRTRKFCSLDCCWKWRKVNGTKGTFKPGIIPWNTGTKGVMKENSGSFKAGMESAKKRAIGSVTFRKDKSGKVRAWVKIANNSNPYDWQLRTVVNWENANGKVPTGMIVHHRNRNTLDDKLSNLKLLSRADHLSEHRHEFEEKRSTRAGKSAKKRHAATRLRKG